MADFNVEFDDDKEITKTKLSKLVGEFGQLTWSGDQATFTGASMASGIKGEAEAAESGSKTSVNFNYTLPLKLKMLGGTIEGQIRKAIETAGGCIL